MCLNKSKFLTEEQAKDHKLNEIMCKIENEIARKACAGEFTCDFSIDPLQANRVMEILLQANFKAWCFLADCNFMCTIKVDWSNS